MEKIIPPRIDYVNEPPDREALSTMISSRLRGFFLFACASVPFGIVLHLLTEAAALGTQHLGASFFQRHEYLIILAVLTALVGLKLARPYARLSPSVITATLMRDLPFKGHARGLFASAFALQFAFLGITIAAEGNTASGGDWLTAGLVALVVATVGSSILTLLPRQLIHSIAAYYMVRHELYFRTLSVNSRRIIRRCIIIRGFLTTLGNRPPPLVLG
jgi:hypothetical protein